MSCSFRQSRKDSSDVSTLLHGNDSELIFLIHPDQEGLFVVVENASALWPVSVKTTGIKESISLFEQKVVVDKLLLLLRSH